MITMTWHTHTILVYSLTLVYILAQQRQVRHWPKRSSMCRLSSDSPCRRIEGGKSAVSDGRKPCSRSAEDLDHAGSTPRIECVSSNRSSSSSDVELCEKETGRLSTHNQQQLLRGFSLPPGDWAIECTELLAGHILISLVLCELTTRHRSPPPCRLSTRRAVLSSPLDWPEDDREDAPISLLSLLMQPGVSTSEAGQKAWKCSFCTSSS